MAQSASPAPFLPPTTIWTEQPTLSISHHTQPLCSFSSHRRLTADVHIWSCLKSFLCYLCGFGRTVNGWQWGVILLNGVPSPQMDWSPCSTLITWGHILLLWQKEMKPLLYAEELTTPSFISAPSLSVFHCRFFSLSLSSVCLSSRVFHPDQSGILSRLLWSLHHNYGAVGTGEIRDDKKREEWKKATDEM